MRVLAATLVFLLATSASARDLNGQEIAEIYMRCTQAAAQKCPASNIYCTAFRRSFVKICLIQEGVPPDYVQALLN